MGMETLAGDFGEHTVFLDKRKKSLQVADKFFSNTLIPYADIENLQIQTEASVKSLVGIAGWATAGALLAGPVGALVGALAGGNTNTVLFMFETKDGKKALAKADSGSFQKLQAELF